MPKKIEVAERIVNDLLDYGYVDLQQELYEEQKQQAIKVVLHRLEDYVIVEGGIVE